MKIITNKNGKELKNDVVRIKLNGNQSEVCISELCNALGKNFELYLDWCNQSLKHDGMYILDIAKKPLKDNLEHYNYENELLRFAVKELKTKNTVLRNKLQKEKAS